MTADDEPLPATNPDGRPEELRNLADSSRRQTRQADTGPGPAEGASDAG